MATVIPGSDFEELYTNRNITKGNVQGDSYLVRRSANDANLDTRSGNDWKQNVIDKMTLSAKIWAGKPGCWQDYFKRSKKVFSYGSQWDNPVIKTLTGYKLGINMLIGSLNNQDGTHFDPECFCIYPTDFIGQRFTSACRFQLQQNRPTELFYDEVHYPEHWDTCEKAIPDPFCSSYAKGMGTMLRLDAPYCTPLFHPLNHFIATPAIENIRDIPMWYPLRLVPLDDQYPYDIPLTDFNHWIFMPGKGRCSSQSVDDGFQQDSASAVFTKAVKAYFQNPGIASNLCGIEQCVFVISHSKEGTVMDIKYREGTSRWAVMWGTQQIYELNLGFGEEITIPLFLPLLTDEEAGMVPLSFNVDSKPAPMGRHAGNSPHGKIIHPSLISCEYTDAVCGCGTFNELIYYYDLGETIYAPPVGKSPQIMIKIESPIRDDFGFQNWWPWGSVTIRAGETNPPEGMFSPAIREIVFNPNQNVYCFDYDGWGGNIRYISLHFRTTTVWSQCCATILKQSGSDRCPNDPNKFHKPSNPMPDAVTILDRNQDSDDFPM